MPKPRYHLTVQDSEEIHALPGSWPLERLRQVLEQAEFDDPVADDEVLGMVLLVLQDLEEQKAGELVLAVVFGQAMGSGVRQNLVDDLADDRPWEQFASVDKQAGIFEAMVLLQQAFPNRYGIPDAVRLKLEISSADPEAASVLAQDPSPALVLRLLAGGMPETAVLNRLYADELASERFPLASAILWQVTPLQSSSTAPGTTTLDVYSSHQWLGPLLEVDAWEARGWPDEPAENRAD